jgi:small subunit ribosomal protein S15
LPAAALLTMDIRNLRAHLIKNMHDERGTHKLRNMAYKRKRILEYLKRLDRVRYDKCLMEIGVDKRAVEGELVIHKFWFVSYSSLPGECSSSYIALP